MSLNIEPKVSVVIPNFNRKEELIRAIDSVLNQSYQNFEILIVDDCSSFSNEEFLVTRGYDKSKKIRFFRNEMNSGISFTRNVGIQHSEGELIALLDSDDFWEKDKLSKQVALFQEMHEIEVLYCDVYLVKNNIASSRNSIFQKENLWNHLLNGWTPPNPSSLVIRKSVFKKIGNFDVNLRHHEDYDFWFRLAKAQIKVGYLEEALSNFSYDSPDRVSNTYKVKFERTHIFLTKWKEEITLVKGKNLYRKFHNDLITKMALETFINSMKFKKINYTLDVYINYLILNKRFYLFMFKLVGSKIRKNWL